jgi:hypothetical protein
MGSNRFTAFDAFLVTLGALFFALTAICVLATIVVLVSWGDPETGFPAGPGFIRFSKGFSLVFFPIAGVVTFFTGWFLAGDHIKRALRRRRKEE